MTRSVTIVDYGIGNLLSATRALAKAGASVRFAEDADGIRGTDRLVLPGVGAFGDCVEELRRRHLIEPIMEFVATGRPMLGICVGMQMLMERSEEYGVHAGFGWIKGNVVPIPRTDPQGRSHKVPHIGWAPLHPAGGDPVAWQGTALEGLLPGRRAYFVHSFMAVPRNPETRLAEVTYNGCAIVAAVHTGNVTGVQFHPEKSGPGGIDILRRFAGL